MIAAEVIQVDAACEIRARLIHEATPGPFSGQQQLRQSQDGPNSGNGSYSNNLTVVGEKAEMLLISVEAMPKVSSFG